MPPISKAAANAAISRLARIGPDPRAAAPRSEGTRAARRGSINRLQRWGGLEQRLIERRGAQEPQLVRSVAIGAL